MKLLIDTPVFIWLINEDKRLGSNASRALQNISNQLYISYFSFFEMTIKASIGKLDYDHSILEDLPKMGIELVMPDTSVLQDYQIFNADNKDPFDTILVAVARTEKCTFVTSDPKILVISAQNLNLMDATK
jgi:PIN domain nuclease of toxin-antitoxin system